MPKLIRGSDLLAVAESRGKLKSLTSKLEGTDPASIERAACAELCRAAGCLCHSLQDSKARWNWPVVDTTPGDGFSGRIVKVVDRHDPRCPEALALAILQRGV